MVGSAELLSSRQSNKLELDCLDKDDKLVVSYILQSSYFPSSALSKPSPLHLKSDKSKWDIFTSRFAGITGQHPSDKKYLPFRDNKKQLLKPSFEAFQYCYELFKKRELIKGILDTMPFPQQIIPNHLI